MGATRPTCRDDEQEDMAVLVTGSTGYIGSQLVPSLLEEEYEVRVLVRDREKLARYEWSDRVKVHVGDLLDASTLPAAMEEVSVAYYLVHSMKAGQGFESRDRRAAENFANAAASVDHVVYLGGLLPKGGDVSEHLASRAEVGEVLMEHCAVTQFRAGPIIGKGSGSFDMLRHLVDRLPVMVVPKWAKNDVQPIAIQDVLSYLTEAANNEPLGIVEIGGQDVVTFQGMMLTYARMQGLRRFIVTVPVLTPHLAALWVQLVTPIPNRLAVPLIMGITKPIIADASKAREQFPQIEPISYEEAVQRAIHTNRGV